MQFRADSLDNRDALSFLAGRSEEPLRFDDRGLIPCIVQQQGSGEVLMMAWMNAESIRLTLETGTTWFWSRARQELWNKGATSGNKQALIDLRYDCDADCLLAIVDSPGPACHTGERSCFFRSLLNDEID
ncbi:MAG: phosphoribosyl-AMP cyclohydrolase [Coriobacteriales bacterium]|nr:phosphoribosyl-AMP cyclohydrolase [Coriobacteriales bacterium]MBQ6585985.1 phosphoribosyl-AMP cyclohydrolase [Coriobacteriales bacterium]